jgi:hypothetical protein
MLRCPREAGLSIGNQSLPRLLDDGREDLFSQALPNKKRASSSGSAGISGQTLPECRYSRQEVPGLSVMAAIFDLPIKLPDELTGVELPFRRSPSIGSPYGQQANVGGPRQRKGDRRVGGEYS